ncbi:MAG: hypothetical protein HY761_06140 [Candidatus Omnitrophica bacterium]|nr:hypothetical protein [Candidatus Omnitrophota bacterium]
MPYDINLDKQVFAKSLDTEEGRVNVSVFSYNNGPKKLQITREVKNREGQLTFTRLGRLSKEEAEGIMPFIKEALNQM